MGQRRFVCELQQAVEPVEVGVMLGVEITPDKCGVIESVAMCSVDTDSDITVRSMVYKGVDPLPDDLLVASDLKDSPARSFANEDGSGPQSVGAGDVVGEELVGWFPFVRPFDCSGADSDLEYS